MAPRASLPLGQHGQGWHPKTACRQSFLCCSQHPSAVGGRALSNTGGHQNRRSSLRDEFVSIPSAGTDPQHIPKSRPVPKSARNTSHAADAGMDRVFPSGRCVPNHCRQRNCSSRWAASSGAAVRGVTPGQKQTLAVCLEGSSSAGREGDLQSLLYQGELVYPAGNVGERLKQTILPNREDVSMI